MNENQTIQLAEIPLRGLGGTTWNRLHDEREDLCEALLTNQAHQQQQLLQARLRTIDDALDRLMSNAYGTCSNCGRTLDSVVLEVDPACALCAECMDSKASNRSPIESLELVDNKPAESIKSNTAQP